jgi:hypothetical protein
MFPAPLVLTLLIIATPAVLVFDGLITLGLVTATAAVLVAIIATRIRPGEVNFLSSLIYAVAIAAAIPALWMLVQILPLGSFGLANPIWDNAAAALGQPTRGSISIDPGATLLAMAKYLSMVAIAFVAAAVAIDRHRAEWLLFAQTTSTSLIALMVVAGNFGIFTIANVDGARLTTTAATDCAGLGVIIATTAMFHTIERAQRRSTNQDGSVTWFRFILVGYIVALALCCWAIIVTATSQTYFAVTCGIATLIIVVVIRRFHLGPWGYSAIAAIASVIAIAAVSLQASSQSLGLMLAFTSQSPPPLVALTQRILAGTPWAGTGAGTIAALLPIYRDINEMATGSLAPNAVAAIAIEMGRPFLLAVAVATVGLTIMLMRGAVRRSRDSFYSTVGASCVVTIALLAFGNAGVLSNPLTIIAASVIGVAIAQSKSRLV